MTLLFASSPAFDDTGRRVALMQGCDPARQSAYRGASHGTLEILVMREAAEADGKAQGYRWPSWSSNKKNAVLVQDFAIRADMSLSAYPAGRRRLFNFRVEFDVRGTMDAKHAAAVARTLGFAEKHAEVHMREGVSIDFLIMARDVLGRFGVREFVAYIDDTARGDLSNQSLFVTLPQTRSILDYANAIIDKISG